MPKQYATLKDVAKKAKTTAATVSYILNGNKNRYISEDMRERVLQAAKELNYVKSSAASSLRGKQRKMIAVLVPQFINQFFTQVVLAIEKVADEYGYVLSICNTFDDTEREKDVIQRMQQQRMDGYIIIPTKAGAENTKQIRDIGIPLVIVDRSIEGVEKYNWVTTKNYQCSYVGVEYLIKKGHRKIAFIGWDSEIPDLIKRETAYRDAIKENNINPSNILVLNGIFTAEAGYDMTKEILLHHSDVTAIFYAYNIQAIGGIRYLRERKIIAGKDISVVLIGSPDWAVIGNYTRIDQRAFDLGTKAARLIFEVIYNKNSTDFGHIMQNCVLIEGDSVVDIK
ncbi:MAG: LacI family transcriptional regulator [Fusobacteriaceae bacterium]|jgi:LacI family transcriptional regulator|nr:LacI family transcriptional regulator [Fusobacteriaceae bacterium]